MQCKFCLKEKKLIDAHIIPRCFYEDMRDNRNKPFLVLTNTAGKHRKKSYVGLYDPYILCENCEKIFQKYDDYACKLLLANLKDGNFILGPSGNKIGYKLNGVDYKKLKLFFLSVLWRASVSEREEFKKVDTGQFEKSLRNMIQDDNPGEVNDFLIVIRRFNDILGQNFLMDPYKLRIDGLNFYRFYLGTGYELHIKVDKRKLKTTDSLYQLALKPSNLLYIPFRDNFLQSKEFPVFRNIIQSNKNYDLFNHPKIST